MTTVKATNYATGEIIELPVDTPTDIVLAYRTAQHYEKVAGVLKNQLKKQIPNMLDERGVSDIIDKYQFKRIEMQRTTYDINMLRDVFDEDEIALFLKVHKASVDNYVKENRTHMTNEQLFLLKHGIVPDGNVVTQIRLEQVIP